MRAPSPARPSAEGATRKPSAEGATREPGPDGASGEPLAAAHAFLSRLRRPSTVLVAVSGGSDSVGLLLALHRASTTSGASHRLVACTVDHALRAGSAAEADAVSRRCKALGIPHTVARWSHSGVPSALQASARLARYRLLREAAQSFEADLVVTGHSRDDQVETVAMRAARSQNARPAGEPPPIGLAGMADAVLFDRALWICRPFLSVRRQAIRDDLTSLGEGWIDDPSNDDPRFERVRFRQAGADIAGPEAGDASRDATLRRAKADAAVSRLLTDHVRLHAATAADIALADLDVADSDGQRLLAVLATTLAGKPHAMGQETAARLCKALVTRMPGAFTAGGCVFEQRGGRLFIYRERRNLPPPTTVEPGQALIWDGRFRIENHGATGITLLAGADRDLAGKLMAGGVPSGVAGRIAQAFPGVSFPDGATADPNTFSLTPVIAPYDTFLPRFDLMIAQSMAALFNRAPFPTCPVDDISMK
ncbi:tRNA lysidine(34) synthetase TilS [Rhizobium sp. NFR03]|uniref:tRNA lysidine(34) synthetase TilS n=1 Tax=Rhizobium sp. NFR03 TaxID=1566263 RepID=UPI0008BADEA6|nr:tRNA lysidine(34) synthetase TilS [Rhizobium sp. NFR03]SES33820.1 tRNA(Ile)-lysidine synthase [Rhizobium sp. NFR03]